jgi:hypothetical protein
MQFTNPIWLWALTGLSIPIGIHLLSRKDGKIIKIGSIRHLKATSTKQFKSIRLNELVLLTLRCLLITGVVFFLSGLHFHGFEQKSKWLYVEKGLMNDPEFAFLIDSLRENGFQLKSYGHDFPGSEDSVTENSKLIYWNLVQKLKTNSLEQAVILTYNYAEGFKGKRVALPSNIQWISKNPEPSEYVLAALRLSDDSVTLQIGKSNPNKTTFYDKRILNPEPYMMESNHSDSIGIELPDTLSFAVVSDPSFEYDQKIMVAALRVIDKNSPYSLIIKTLPVDYYSQEDKSDWVIWLSDQPPPNLKPNGIYYQKVEPSHNDVIFRKKGENKFIWILTARLNEEVMLRENLTVQLAEIISLSRNERYDGRAGRFDKRTMPEELIWDPHVPVGTEYQVMNTTSSQHYIVLVLLVVLFLERWIAFKRNR